MNSSFRKKIGYGTHLTPIGSRKEISASDAPELDQKMVLNNEEN